MVSDIALRNYKQRSLSYKRQLKVSAPSNGKETVCSLGGVAFVAAKGLGVLPFTSATPCRRPPFLTRFRGTEGVILFSRVGLCQEKLSRIKIEFWHRCYFVGFWGAGPDLFPGNPGTLLWSCPGTVGLCSPCNNDNRCDKPSIRPSMTGPLPHARTSKPYPQSDTRTPRMTTHAGCKNPTDAQTIPGQ